ncbi:MAG: DUF1013 domain-containing protein [Alphaproteobacteria bacterium]|nr:DUF1013 domain-containing protein [Alphaproteobacteria bacterium]MBU0858318.1 DUF1013 domain-containing protein [Alphaproteobacteria bacterium]
MCAKQIEATGLLMPKATAVWLVENTALTFEQIADFTGMHPIEVQALADEEVGRGIVGRNPVEHHEITPEELEKAQANDTYMMRRAKTDLPTVKLRAKGPKYTPVSKRSDKPDAIAYILKNNPEISEAQICKLVGTTKPTIQAVRDRTHPNSSTLKPRHPVDLGLCTYMELEAASNKGFRAQGKDPEEIKRQRDKALEEQANERAAEASGKEDKFASFDFSNFLSGGRKSDG